MPKENPADPNSKSLETHFENLTTYKNRNGGVWGRGELFVVRNLKTADNAIGFTMSSGSFGRDAFTSLVVDSLFVGETENIGNPVTPEEKAYGRSLPKRLIPDFPIRGYEYYDYRVDVANTTFVNFQDNKQRGSGALSWLLFTSSGVTTENTIKGAKYVNAKPVYFPKIDTRFDNDNRGGVGLPDPGDPRSGRLDDRHPQLLCSAQRRRERQRRHGRHLQDPADLERLRVHG